MKARQLICPEVRRIEIQEVELGPPPADGVVVRNEYTAVSIGTELWIWTHGGEPGRPARFPATTGYCNAGTVVEVGRNVTGLKPGDRVAGQGHHASHSIISGIVNRVPDGVSTKAASLLTMAAIAQHGIRVTRIEIGEAVAVMGLGLVGQFCATLAHLSGGLPVIGLDVDRFRLDKAAARGADVLLKPDEIEDLPAAVREHCEEDGANCLLECTGIPAVYPTAVKLPCFGGRMVAVGSPRGTVEFDFMRDVHLREVSILGAIHPRTPERDHVYFHWTKRRERDLLLRLMQQDRLPVEDLITHVEKPEDCQSVYERLADRPEQTLAVLFEWER